MKKLIIKLTLITLLLIVLSVSSITVADNSYTYDDTIYSELSYNGYEGDILVLSNDNNYCVSIVFEFEFHIQADELCYYTDANYYYDMINDILIIYDTDGQLIYSDFRLVKDGMR